MQQYRLIKSWSLQRTQQNLDTLIKLVEINDAPYLGIVRICHLYEDVMELPHTRSEVYLNPERWANFKNLLETIDMEFQRLCATGTSVNYLTIRICKYTVPFDLSRKEWKCALK